MSVIDQVELALAYGCINSVGSEALVQYIHHNRNHNARRIDTMGKTFEGFKTEMRKDVVENLAEQEQRIANNSDLISTNKEGVATNEALVREVEAKIAEQKRETASMLG